MEGQSVCRLDPPFFGDYTTPLIDAKARKETMTFSDKPTHDHTQKTPYYACSGDEIMLFEAAYAARLPVMLKGPTGCGKTRFVEFMAHRLGLPLITVSCHEDLFASDLLGRYLLLSDQTVWVDGPLTRAVRSGAVCYLDEIVEARKDTTVVIHPLTDSRRTLFIDKIGESIEAHPDFIMVISYNPGYQSILKDLKQSTRQRFVSLAFDYPDPSTETEIVSHEGGVDSQTAFRLVSLAVKIRQIREHGLTEGASTRLLIYAAQLIGRGVSLSQACRTAICLPLTDDFRLLETLNDLIEDIE
ncbi:MAG: CbbQ/NirQ/NorQ/GpvN family protein [Desulfatirhabdiaceae bacterium]